MPKHTTLWLMAGGSAVLSAALTYAVTRPSAMPVVSRIRRGGSWLSTRITGLFPRQSYRAADTAGARWDNGSPPVQSSAFEAYRADMLRRLADDERSFQDFLERLRHAKDRAEFDQFMAERRGMDRPTPHSGA